MRTIKITRINGRMVMCLEKNGQTVYILPIDINHFEDWIDDGQCPSYAIILEPRVGMIRRGELKL